MKWILLRNTSEVGVFKTSYLQPVGDLVQYFSIITVIYIKSHIKSNDKIEHKEKRRFKYEKVAGLDKQLISG